MIPAATAARMRHFPMAFIFDPKARNVKNKTERTVMEKGKNSKELYITIPAIRGCLDVRPFIPPYTGLFLYTL
jgi:hypothetical protein